MAAPDNTLILRPRVQSAAACLRPTRAEVDLSAIAHNLREVRRASGRGVLAVIKADAYGHGAVPVAKRLEEEGARGFGVALAEEAIELRDAGIGGEILILNGIVGGAHQDVLHRGLVPVLYDEGELEAFRIAAAGKPFRVHLKVDTGMARLGVPMAELEGFLDKIAAVPGARVAGLMTHLATADTDDAYTNAQLKKFQKAISMVHAAGHTSAVIHAANSAASFRHPAAHFDMVRPGIALFGDSGYRAEDSGLRPALRLRTEVISLRSLSPGDRAGYDGAFVAERPTTLAILPAGYGDGLLYSSAGKGGVLIHGVRCPFVGRISMDLSHVDVTDVPATALGDEAVLLGHQGGASLSARHLADAAGTIPYEVLTSISRRVPRFYTS